LIASVGWLEAGESQRQRISQQRSVVGPFDQYLNWLGYGVYKIQSCNRDVLGPCRGTYCTKCCLISVAASVDCRTYRKALVEHICRANGSQCGPGCNLTPNPCIEHTYIPSVVEKPVHEGLHCVSSDFGDLGGRARYFCEGAGKARVTLPNTLACKKVLQNHSIILPKKS
jgi:hypothetical protein